jgi:C-terminal processing protease CtpA/Prc
MQISRLTSLLIICLFLFSVSAFSAAIDQEKMVMVKASDHLRLGVVVSDINKDKNDVKVDKGAYVIDVIDDSPAEEAGIAKGDVIVKFDSKNVESADDLEDYVEDIKEPKAVDVVVNRDGKEQTIKARVEQAKKEKNYTVTVDDDDILVNGVTPKIGDFDVWVNKADDKGGFLGVQAKNISESMLSYFEVDQGVLIEEVVDDSPAQKAGFKAGDVITKINDREIKDYDDLIRTLNYFNPGEKVTVYYSRKGTKKNVSVTLAEKKGNDQKIKIKKMIKGDKGLNWVGEGDKVFKLKGVDEDTPGFRFFDKEDNVKIKIL